MTTCPIFQTFGAARSVSVELDQLVGDIVARFRKADAALFRGAEDFEWDDLLPDEHHEWVQSGGAIFIEMQMRRGSGTPRTCCLTLRFDLYRAQSDESQWEHAAQSLMAIAYSPLKDQPWQNEGLQIAADGRLKDDGTWNSCKNNRHAGGRLLQYSQPELVTSPRWHQNPWIYAIPLVSLDSPQSVDQHIIAPVMNLLSEDGNPDKALIGVSAVEWAKPQ